MPIMQMTLNDKEIIQAVRDYVLKLGYTTKTPITFPTDLSITITVEKHYPSYGGGKD